MIWMVIAGVLGLVFLAVPVQTYYESVAGRFNGAVPERPPDGRRKADVRIHSSNDGGSAYQTGIIMGLMSSDTASGSHPLRHAEPSNHDHSGNDASSSGGGDGGGGGGGGGD